MQKKRTRFAAAQSKAQGTRITTHTTTSRFLCTVSLLMALAECWLVMSCMDESQIRCKVWNNNRSRGYYIATSTVIFLFYFFGSWVFLLVVFSGLSVAVLWVGCYDDKLWFPLKDGFHLRMDASIYMYMIGMTSNIAIIFTSRMKITSLV
jgi:hypothetical protein